MLYQIQITMSGAEGSEVILLRACPDRCRYRSWRCFADVTVPEPVDSCVYPPFSVKSTPDSRHGIRTRSFGFSIIWIQYERTGLHMYVHAGFHAKRPPRRTRQAHTGSDSHYREEIAQGEDRTRGKIRQEYDHAVTDAHDSSLFAQPVLAPKINPRAGLGDAQTHRARTKGCSARGHPRHQRP